MPDEDVQSQVSESSVAESVESEPVDSGQVDGGQVEQSAEPVVEWDEQLLQDAELLGLPTSAAKSFGSPHLLRGYIANQVRLMREREAPRNVPVAKEPEKPAYGEWPSLKFDLPEDIDPELGNFAKQVKAMHDALAARVSEYEKRFGKLSEIEKDFGSWKETNAKREAQQRVADFDSHISKLGSEYEAILGKGASFALKRSNPDAYAKRQELADELEAIENRFPDMPFEQQFQRALAATLYDQTQTVARRGVQQTVQKRQSLMVGRPGQKTGTVDRADEKAEAIRAMKEADRKHGLAV